MAMIDQDTVLASTTLIAGKVEVAVTSAGEDTTSAKLTRILNDTAGYTLHSQSKGEELADKAVLPTLALGALGLATLREVDTFVFDKTGTLTRERPEVSRILGCGRYSAQQILR